VFGNVPRRGLAGLDGALQISSVAKREQGERFDLVDGQGVRGELSVQLQFGGGGIRRRRVWGLRQGAMRNERELSRLEFDAAGST